MKAFLSGVLSIAIMLCFLKFIAVPTPTTDDHEIFSRQYVGEMTFSGHSYYVEIEETQRPQSLVRIVNLYPLQDGQSPSQVSRQSYITGHDNNLSGLWSRILYCGYRVPANDGTTNTIFTGCNSIILEESGNLRFEPCPGDAGKVKPFSKEQVLFAILALDEAVLQIRNPSHLRHAYFWNPEENMCDMVISEDAKPVQW